MHFFIFIQQSILSDLHSSIDSSSPTSKYPHYLLFLTDVAVSFVGNHDLETVQQFLSKRLKIYGFEHTGDSTNDQIENKNDLEMEENEAKNVVNEMGENEAQNEKTYITENESNDEKNVVILTDQNFDQTISNGVWFVEFYAPWCGFCKKIMPVWSQLANQFENDQNVNIAKVDATENEALSERFNIKGYPTLILIRDQKVFNFERERTLEAMKEFIESSYKSSPSSDFPKAIEQQEDLSLILTSANFSSSVAKGVWMVEFYAPWCGFCKRLKPTWSQLATELKSLDINVAKVNVDVEEDLANVFEIQYLPTVVMIRENKVYKFEGSKELKELTDFAKTEWKNANLSALPIGEVDSSDVIALTDANYNASISSGVWLIEFYAPWCGFCKKLKPVWAQLATKIKESNSDVKIAWCDSVENTEVSERFGVEGYPTIYLFRDGKKYPFSGERNIDNFLSFIESGWKQFEHKALALDSSNVDEKDVIVLDDKNLISQVTKGEWLVEFYAPWCGFCKNLKPIYSNLASYVKNKLSAKFNVAKIDVDANNEMAALFGIKYLPTIYYFKDGRIYKNEEGRTFDTIIKFTENLENSISFPMPIFESDVKYDEKDVVEFTDNNFEEKKTNAKYWLVEFYAPWCGYCKKLAPTWSQLATFVKEKMGAEFGIAKIDGTANQAVVDKFGDISGYPTLFLLDTSTNSYTEYEGGRNLPEFYDYLKEISKIPQEKFKKLFGSKNEKELSQKEQVETLSESNFYQKISSGVWMVEFYASWCGFCKKLAPEYERLNNFVKENMPDKNYHVAKVNVENDNDLSEKFNVQYLPTVFVVFGDQFWKFEGTADYDNLLKFLKQDYLEANATKFEIPKKSDKPNEKPLASEDSIIVLEDKDFYSDGKVTKGIWLVDFYAPWCGHCKNMKPTYAQLATDLKDSSVNVGWIDATVHSRSSSIFEVSGFPTIIYIENGKWVEYLGSRELSDFKSFIEGKNRGKLVEAKFLTSENQGNNEEEKGIDDDSDVVVLKDSNFFSKISNGVWLVDFYAPWCGHCKNLTPKWNLLAKKMKNKIKVGKVDITTEKKLTEAFSPKYLPTIYLIIDGFYYKFDGKREISEFILFSEINYKKFDAKKLPPPIAVEEQVSKEHLITLNDDNLFESITKGEWFIEFYTPWCGFCKKLAPIYARFSHLAHQKMPQLSVAQFDAEENALAGLFGVSAYPTLIFLRDGNYYIFDGFRTEEAMLEFAESTHKKVQSIPIPSSPIKREAKKEERNRKITERSVGNVVSLNQDNFQSLTSKGTWLVSFMIPCDGFSKKMNNLLEDLYHTLPNVSLGFVDSIKFESLAKKYSINNFPTLLLISENQVPHRLDRNVNTIEKIKQFVESKIVKNPATKTNKKDEL